MTPNILASGLGAGMEAATKGVEVARLALPPGPALNGAVAKTAGAAINASEAAISGITKAALAYGPIALLGLAFYSGIRLLIGSPVWPADRIFT